MGAKTQMDHGGQYSGDNLGMLHFFQLFQNLE